MAVTRIWRVRAKLSADKVLDYAGNPEKTAEEGNDTNSIEKTDEQRDIEISQMVGDEISDVDDVLNYADDEFKTDYHHYTTGINCDKDHVKEEFNMTKMRFNKQGGIVAIHGYQSFEEENLSPDEAHEIGVALAKELWGDRFQVLVATHLNTDHVHNHFVVNSVSFLDGHRFHMCTAQYMRMKEASDRLCREHALSVIENPQGKAMGYYCWMLERDGMPTRYSVARKALDEAISRSVNMEELKYELSTYGLAFQCSPNRKYWTVTVPGWTKPIRTNRLGPDYSRERIMERIYENDETVRYRKFQEMYSHHPNNYHIPKRINKINARTGLEKLYLRVCYELGYLPKYTQDPLKVHRLFRDEIYRCDMYAHEARLLGKYKIYTKEDLEGFVESEHARMETISNERDELRKVIKRKVPNEEKDRAREEITKLTSEMRDIRTRLKLCDDIRERSGVMDEKVRELDKENEREVVRT